MYSKYEYYSMYEILYDTIAPVQEYSTFRFAFYYATVVVDYIVDYQRIPGRRQEIANKAISRLVDRPLLVASYSCLPTLRVSDA